MLTNLQLVKLRLQAILRFGLSPEQIHDLAGFPAKSMQLEFYQRGAWAHLLPFAGVGKTTALVVAALSRATKKQETVILVRDIASTQSTIDAISKAAGISWCKHRIKVHHFTSKMHVLSAERILVNDI